MTEPTTPPAPKITVTFGGKPIDPDTIIQTTVSLPALPLGHEYVGDDNATVKCHTRIGDSMCGQPRAAHLPQHVCGLQGFGRGSGSEDDRCPACQLGAGPE